MPATILSAASSELHFLSESVATIRGFLTPDTCSDLVASMIASPWEHANVVRAGESVVDRSLRNCKDHHCPQTVVGAVGAAGTASAILVKRAASRR